MKIKLDTKAFSLVELLIVIAIIAIVGAISAPTFTRFRGNACLREATRKLTSDIQLCRHSAVAENTRYRIVLNVETSSYLIQKETSPSNWTSVSCIKNLGEEDAAVKMGGKQTHAAHKIIFQPRGTTNAGTLELQHETLHSRASIVTSLMGRVRVQYYIK